MSRYIHASLALEARIYRKVRHIVVFRYVVASISSIGVVLLGLSVWGEVSYFASFLFEQGALTYWKDIVFSVAEALPFLATLGFFVSITLSLWSLTNIYAHQKGIRYSY